MKYIPLVGRVLYSLIFILSGVNHLINFSRISEYTASLGVPAPALATIITGIMILAGGLSILIGYKVKVGALLLIIFLVPVTLVAHNFWAIEDAVQSQIQMVMFLKNLALLGGALVFYYFGSGPLSLEKQVETDQAQSQTGQVEAGEK